MRRQSINPRSSHRSRSRSPIELALNACRHVVSLCLQPPPLIDILQLMPDLSAARIPLYLTLWLFSIILLALTAARIDFTNKIGFYEQVIAELLVCSLFALLFAPFVLRFVHRYSDHEVLSYHPITVELVALAILWLMWLIGAAVASTDWPDLSACQSSQCSLISAILGFAWLGWITIIALIVVATLPYISVSKNRANVSTA